MLMAVLPSMEGRRRWAAGHLHFEATEHNLRLLRSSVGAEVEGAVEAPPKGTPRPKLPRKTQPIPHQEAGVDHFGDKNVMALFMEQGTGKTKTSIDWADDLYAAGEIDAIMVVSRRGAHRQWVLSELPKHMASPFSAVYWGQRANPQPKPGGLEIISINWDGMKTKAGEAWVLEFLQRHKGRVLIIADEAQDMKNYESGRHKAMQDFKPYSSHRAVLTGTPIAKDLTDEWAILRWLDEKILGIKYVTTFRAMYCTMGGFQNRSVVGHKELGKFRELTSPYVFRVTKEDIGLLPKQYDEWTFDMTGEQRRMIADLRRDARVQWEGGLLDRQGQAQVVLKAQQISNGFIRDENKVTHWLLPPDKNPRIIAALEWLDSTDAKALIWCRFRDDIAALQSVLGNRFVTYVGGMKDAEQQATIASFLDPEGAQVMLATSAASTGLNLQGSCNRALYYSEAWNAVDRWQKEDRIDRIGTVGFTTHTDLIAVGGSDRAIHRNRAKKKGISDLAIGGLSGNFNPEEFNFGGPQDDVAEIFEAFLGGDD